MGRRLDVLLVNPGGRARAYQALGAALAAVEPPIWAGLLASFVRRKGFSVAILDTNAEELEPLEAARRAAAADPLLTVIVVYGHNPSASTQVMPAAGELCRALKEHAPALKVMLLGGHVAALPARTLQEETADYVCGGEGPYTVCELVEALRSSPPELAKVRGLYFRNERGTITATPPAPLVEDLDREMPGVAWDLLPMARYRAHNWHCFGDMRREPYGALYTTLGCPFHCSFCCIQAPFRDGEKALGVKHGVNSYRRWSPGAVIAQLDTLVRDYGVRNVKFADELFVHHEAHVTAICDLVRARGYDLNIWAYARVDTTRPELLERLSAAGIRWLALGIESGNARVRKDVKKPFAPEKLFDAVARMRAHDINICGNYIFGLPEDDLASMQDTLDLAIEVNAEWGNLYCAMAYPGSQLYERALAEGWPLPRAWSGYSQLSVDTTPLPTRYLSAADVLRFRDEAFEAYYAGERYLGRIREKFGEETLAHIHAMRGQKITRELYR